ncbi:hypothetical protein GCM10008943_32540 [Paenochrobactrum glaciei]|uniref:Uncharacterized protein n=1 Tax=Paenochrobactrum glaciei TaxID=486407 RepID=A0ABN1GN12_9HYPH
MNSFEFESVYNGSVVLITIGVVWLYFLHGSGDVVIGLEDVPLNRMTVYPRHSINL